jgi:hypothetical protein
MLLNSPISDYWTLSLTPQNCFDEEKHLLVSGILGTTTDFTIVLLPIKTATGLRSNMRLRLIIYILFACGFMASIAGIVRTYYCFWLTASPDLDYTWNTYPAVLFASVELYLGIVSQSDTYLLS